MVDNQPAADKNGPDQLSHAPASHASPSPQEKVQKDPTTSLPSPNDIRHLFLTLLPRVTYDILATWLTTHLHFPLLALIWLLTPYLRRRLFDDPVPGVPIHYSAYASMMLNDALAAAFPDPCAKHLNPTDPTIKTCTTALADACHRTSALFGQGRLGLSRVCEDLFVGIDAKAAAKHVQRCHRRQDEMLPYLALTACVRVNQRLWEEDAACPAFAAILVRCAERFGLDDEIFRELGLAA